jgi:hypothetical protein
MAMQHVADGTVPAGTNERHLCGRGRNSGRFVVVKNFFLSLNQG